MIHPESRLGTCGSDLHVFDGAEHHYMTYFCHNWKPIPPATPESDDERMALQTIDERDRAEDALSEAYMIVTGEQAEWSNLFGYEEALQEMREKMEELEDQANKLNEAAFDETEPAPTLDTLLRQHHLSFRCSRKTYEWYMGRQLLPKTINLATTRFNLAYGLSKDEQVDFTFDDTLAFKQWVPVVKTESAAPQPAGGESVYCFLCGGSGHHKGLQTCPECMGSGRKAQPAGEGTLPPPDEFDDSMDTIEQIIPKRHREAAEIALPLCHHFSIQGSIAWFANHLLDALSELGTREIQILQSQSELREVRASLMKRLALHAVTSFELSEARASLTRLREIIRRLFAGAENADFGDGVPVDGDILRELREEAKKVGK